MLKDQQKGRNYTQSEQYDYFRIHQKKDCYSFMVA